MAWRASSVTRIAIQPLQSGEHSRNDAAKEIWTRNGEFLTTGDQQDAPDGLKLET
jgi:hypothetical protein